MILIRKHKFPTMENSIHAESKKETFQVAPRQTSGA